MNDAAASEVVGSSLVLFITVAGIALTLLVGLPVLSSVQGQAQAKSIAGDFASAARDIEGGGGKMNIPLSVPGALSLSTTFGGNSLGFSDGTSGFISGGDYCSLALPDWGPNTFTVGIGDDCNPTNTDGNCELVAQCLAIDHWENGKFLPQTYSFNSGVATMDSELSGVYRISIYNDGNGTRAATGFFFTQKALVFESGPGRASLESGGFHNGFPLQQPNLVNGTNLVLMSGGGAISGPGTRTLELQFMERLPVFKQNVTFVDTSFKGLNQVAWCFAVSPAVPDCGGTVARTSYDSKDDGISDFSFRIALQLAEGSIGL